MKPIKVNDKVHEILSEVSEQTNITLGDIVGYLTDLLVKYNLMDPDWLEPIIEESVKEYLTKHDLDLAKKLELERSKTINKAKLEAFKQYLNVLEPEIKKGFLENILGNVNDESFLDSISNYQMFMIDGVRKLFQVDTDGKPIIPGLNKEQLVTCMIGYHFIGNFCKCNKWRDCKIRNDEYTLYLAKTDPNMRKEKTRRYVESYR